MESYGEANCKMIDPSVGGLVWVRRRNGSWWPGRILGPDELPESCLISPRSGTPVKLLGREDASVDWYNLEKSKRVKAFRCGEYDECIEKAKASAVNSCKKAVKYARREDAILHALELESARLSKSRPNTCSGMDKPGDTEELPIPFCPDEQAEGMSAKSSNFEDNSSSPQELTQSSVSFEEPCRIGVAVEHSVQGRKRKTPNDSEDDGREGTKKRMRGLEDLGVGGSLFKRRRSQVAHVHEILKRKNRRRQLTKVLESTAMVNVPVMCEPLTYPSMPSLPGVSDSKLSEPESSDSKRSFSAAINNNNSDSTGDASNNATGHECDVSLADCKQKESEISSMSGLLENDSSERLFDVPLTGEEKQNAGISTAYVSFTSQKPHVGAGAQSSQSSLVETVSVGNDEILESGSTSSGAANISNISHIIDNKDTSKWQLKGKRNSRNKSKIKKEDSGKFGDVDVLDSEILVSADGFDCGVKSEQVIESHSIEAMAPQRLMPYRQSRFTVNPKYQSSDFDCGKHGTGTLYDVNVEVKAVHRPHHVPYISLMSKFNGRPIIGHPLLVEVLADGTSDILSNTECYSSSCELDWHLLVEDVNRSKSGANPSTELSIRGSPRKSSKKPRRNGLLSNKKIRRLSSLTGSKRPNDKEEKSVLAVEKLKGPCVACVPLKVVFSRIFSLSVVKPLEKGTVPTDLRNKEQVASVGHSAGLFNLGNTCYMNSTMQCLHSVPELKSALSEYPQPGRNLDLDLSSHLLTVATRDLFNQLDKNVKPVAPTQFWMVLRKKYPQFGQLRNGSFVQQDAEECWTWILCTLSEALRSSSSCGNVDAVKGLFGIDLVSRVHCAESSEESLETETVYSLKAHISFEVNHLHEGLKHGMKSEVEKASPSLGRRAVYSKDSHINGLPRYLTIQFVRFIWKAESNQKAKILRQVDYPLELDIFDLCSDDLREKLEAPRQMLRDEDHRRAGSKLDEKNSTSVDSNAKTSCKQTQLTGLYDLVAVLTHQGTSADSGHYIAWVKQENRKWIQFDDDNQIPQTEEDVTKLSGGGDWHMAYICMYKARSIAM